VETTNKDALSGQSRKRTKKKKSRGLSRQNEQIHVVQKKKGLFISCSLMG
jgi:hypothetical protein